MDITTHDRRECEHGKPGGHTTGASPQGASYSWADSASSLPDPPDGAKLKSKAIELKENTMTTEAKVEVGKEYRIWHSRKGRFCARIHRIKGYWIEAIVTRGQAGAMLADNIVSVGGVVSMRVEHLLQADPID